MLRSMVFQNFVHFEKRFHLDFSTYKNKPFFFIGSSSTGKTAVLELIRRCLSSKLNSSLTNRSDDSKLAFVLCEFELRKENTPSEYDGYGSKVITGLIIAGKDNTDENTDEKKTKSDEDENKAKSNKDENKIKLDNIDDNKKKLDINDENEAKSDNTDKNKTKSDKDEKMTKSHNTNDNHTKPVNRETQTKKNSQCRGNEREQETKGETKTEKQEKDIEFYKIIMYINNESQFKVISENPIVNLSTDGLLKEMPETKNIDENTVQAILDLIRQALHSHENRETDENYQGLWNFISESYVGILPNRGLGCLQWTRSKNRGGNYKTACEQAEIINELLGTEPKDSEVFQFLTNPSTFEFLKNDGDTIVVRQENSETVDNKPPFPLLKTPIGILEAKQFSLVIEYDKFQTITFEEPDRGMHPQMIERMKEILYTKCVNKTVIIVTHSPYLFDYLSMKSTFIFYRIQGSPRILNGLKKIDDNEASKICGEENLKRIFFSSNVLLVEGKSDKLVLEAIFRYIFKNPTGYDYVSVPKILRYQIIATGGFTKAKQVQNFCKDINLPCKAVFDRDVYLDVDGQGQLEGVKELKDFDNVGEQPIQNFLENENGFISLSKKLEEEGKFIWKNGDLEDFLLSKSEQSYQDYRKNLCKLLKMEYNSSWKRKKLKENIKKHLNEVIPHENFEKLAETLLTLNETKRLLKFLNA